MTPTDATPHVTLAVPDATRVLFGAYEVGSMHPLLEEMLPPAAAHLGMHL
jgi:hypothetical protein